MSDLTNMLQIDSLYILLAETVIKISVLFPSSSEYQLKYIFGKETQKSKLKLTSNATKRINGSS